MQKICPWTPDRKRRSNGAQNVRFKTVALDILENYLLTMKAEQPTQTALMILLRKNDRRETVKRYRV
jgi:hypothetical protein